MICLNKAGLASTPYVDTKFRSVTESCSSWDVGKKTKQEKKIKNALKIKKQTNKETIKYKLFSKLECKLSPHYIKYNQHVSAILFTYYLQYCRIKH